MPKENILTMRLQHCHQILKPQTDFVSSMHKQQQQQQQNHAIPEPSCSINKLNSYSKVILSK
jgi:hypothetical protein